MYAMKIKFTVRLVISLICFLLLLKILWLSGYNLFESQPCLNNLFKEYILVIAFSFPYYKNNVLFRDVYGNVFGKVIICGPEPDARSGRNKPDIEFDDSNQYGYYCMGLAVRNNTNYKGYFFIQDDVLLNWWNLENINLLNLWQSGHPDWSQEAYAHIDENKYSFKFWKKNLEHCQNYHQALVRFSKFKDNKFDGNKVFKTYMNNGHGKARCGNGRSNFFYVPHAYAESFSTLSEIGYTNRLISNVAVHNIFRSIDDVDNLTSIEMTEFEYDGVKKYEYDGTERAQMFWKRYSLQMRIIYPLGVNSKLPDERQSNIDKLKEIYLRHVSTLMYC